MSFDVDRTVAREARATSRKRREGNQRADEPAIENGAPA